METIRERQCCQDPETAHSSLINATLEHIPQNHVGIQQDDREDNGEPDPADQMIDEPKLRRLFACLQRISR